MKTMLAKQLRCLSLVTVLVGGTLSSRGQDIIVKPARGGGLDTNAPMIHVDIFYDYAANQMRATLDTSKGIPKLRPLPAGYTLDTRSNYTVLNGKAYNFQYAWNPGGLFTNPPGAAIWIECLSASPELETYDGPGNKMLTVPRPYTPIFGTAGCPAKWQWYGAMAHNSYAILNPTNPVVSAQYRIYFGDAQTGATEAYAEYGDAVITLTWQVDLPATISSLTRQGTTVTARFGAAPSKTYYLERASTLDNSASWRTVAGPLSGASLLQTLNDVEATDSTSFYRLRITEP